ERLAAAEWGDRLGASDRSVLQRLVTLLRDASGASSAASAAPASVGGFVGARVGPSDAAARPHSRAAHGGAGGASFDPELAELTEREHEVLERMARGDSNKLIARAFELSPHTVKRHVANILGKLGVQTRGQAAARWRARAGT
ncbi:MAG: helix-turn-helix transcriptional regulator, partial [Burkholderiaceae bacterium]